jgi:hypothetical protein
LKDILGTNKPVKPISKNGMIQNQQQNPCPTSPCNTK